jgi:hypothetical protein
VIAFPDDLRGLRLIWSHEHRAWWRANRRGYTTELLGAGLYSPEDAATICESSGGRETSLDAEAKWEQWRGAAPRDCLLSRVLSATSRTSHEHGVTNNAD